MEVDAANKNYQDKLAVVMTKCTPSACPQIAAKVKDFNDKFAAEKSVVADELVKQEKMVVEGLAGKVNELKAFIQDKMVLLKTASTLSLQLKAEYDALAAVSTTSYEVKKAKYDQMMLKNAQIEALKGELAPKNTELEGLKTKVSTFQPEVKATFERSVAVLTAGKASLPNITGGTLTAPTPNSNPTPPPQERILTAPAPADGGTAVVANGQNVNSVYSDDEAPTTQVSFDIQASVTATTSGLSWIGGSVLATLALFLMNISF